MSEAAAQPAAIDQTGWLVALGLAKSFGKTMVVHDVSIAVRRGEAVGLLGPNGAGKTTVFTMIMGLIQPDKGEIMLDGLPITRLPMFQRGRLGIGYLPQEPSIFRGLNVEDNILAVLEGHVRDRAERTHAARDAARRVRHRAPPPHPTRSRSRAASGAASRSPAPSPPIPPSCCSTSPSPASTRSPSPTSRRWSAQLTNRGIGVLITDHSVRETLSLVDRAYLIHGGQVMIQGKPETITADPEARRVYLGDTFSV